MKKRKEIINYGAILAQEIEDKKYSKKAICEALWMNFKTLQSRLIDGKFSQAELRILKEKRYIP